MKRTKLRRLLPVLLTLITVIACLFGITAAAEAEAEEVRSGQITHASLVLDNNVDILFYVDVTESAAQERYTFMTFNDGDPVYYSGMKEIGESTYAIYRYNNVSAKDMAKAVNAKFYYESVLTSALNYSVKNYAQLLLTNSDSETLKTLLSDLLVYGAETQALAGDAKEDYVTNGVVGLTPSENHSNKIVLYGSEIKDNLTRGETVQISGSKLSVTNGMELTFDLDMLDSDTDPSEYSVSMSINGREQEVRVASTGFFNRALFNAIYSYELFDNAELNVYKGNVRVSKTFSFSLASYLDALSNKEEYNAITNAYYNYCYSSHVYSGNHTPEVPGDLVAADRGSTIYDDNGTITYKCSLCGKVTDEFVVTHIRDFDSLHSDGNPANKGTGGSLFTIDKPVETREDGSTNTYLSIIRDLKTNTGVNNSFGYYIRTDDARRTTLSDFVDSYDNYKGDAFTFSFDMKAPEAGLAPTTVYLQNTNASSSSGGRYCAVLNINADGSLTLDSNKIAPAGTINSSKWTDISISILRYVSNDTEYMYYEYYVDGKLAGAANGTNILLDDKFNTVYFSAGVSNLSDGQGMLLDNIFFAQGCVRSFYGSVEKHVTSVDSGNLRQLIDKVQNEFKAEDFSWVVRWDGKSNYTYKEQQWLTGNPTNKYPSPEASPKNYDHPRLLFNTDDIPAIIDNMERPENSAAYAKFISQVTTHTDGKLTPIENVVPASFEYTNYSTTVLRAIEAKALYYALFKNSSDGEHKDAVLRGYEAVYAMKNYLLTFAVQWDMSDQCRMYGEVMYYAALVYDWCYDLLTEEDQLQFMLGVQNLCCDGTSNEPYNGTTHEGRKLEGGYPALYIEQQSALTGHGAEAQVPRDYFAFAIAIYDEDPTWYSYVGGMIYANYVDARNYFYSAGYYPDGSAGYNVYRYVCDLYNAWLFKGMGVELPYNEEEMATVIHGLMAMEINDNFMFATADGSGTSSYGQYRLNTTVGDAALISSYLFSDNVALTIAERLCAYEYNRNGFSHQLGISCAYYLILTANDLVPAEDYREKIANVEYHGGFQNQVISRNDKSEDSVVVLNQGGQMYPGGHTHQSAGSFQIWYKGMLTRDDGLYDAYGSDHHFYYHMSSTAHNTLLIYNNNLKGTMIGSAEGAVDYYNGGQRLAAKYGLPVNYAAWINDERYSFGKVIGMATDDEMNPSYVYFANDITNAYDSSTVDYVERSTLIVYTGDAETPMVMFIFDNITSDRADYQKTFLLQCVEAPEINGNTVTVDNGEGKLVLTSLLGADSIKAYGRNSKNGVVGGGNGEERFYLSGAGTNLLPGGAGSIGDSSADLRVVWGHVEIQPDLGNTTDHLMNVIYVSDSGTTVTATPTLIEGQYITGATFKNHTSVFVNDNMRTSDTLSFTAEGEGTMTYYIGGLSNGTWHVKVNGEELGEFKASVDGRSISFEAEAGTVELTPGDDIRPAGTGLIFYELDGGKLPADTPGYFELGKVTPLPTPTKNGAFFEGWYTDKAYTEEIDAIPADAPERLIVYAKWSSPIVATDYTAGGTRGEHSEFSYHLESSGGSFDMVNGSKDGSYLLWTSGGSGDIIGRDGAIAGYADDTLQFSYTLTIGRDGDNALIPFSVYMRDTYTNKLRKVTGNYFLNIFKMDGNGNLYLGNNDKGKFGQIASSGMTTIRFVMDFKTGMMYAYDDNANLIKSVTMKDVGIAIPTMPITNKACYSSYEEWLKILTANDGSIFTMKGVGAGKLRVGGINVWAGNITTACRNFGPNSSTHTWGEPVVVTPPSTTDCTPGSVQYTCIECGTVKLGAIISEFPHSELTKTLVDGKPVYTCTACNCTFSTEAGYVLDGSNLNNIVGSGNNKNYTTTSGTNQPVLTGGAYELINKNGNRGKLELWIPSLNSNLSGFSSANNATGFVSMKVNASTDESFSFYFVDTASGATRWSSEWCLTEAFLTVSATKNANGTTTLNLLGWDSVVLGSVTVSSADSFTDWFEITACIELNDDADTITLHYYVNGEYISTATNELTTKTNAINSICVTGYTSVLGSGLMLDDIYFGFTPNGTWNVPTPVAEASEE